MNTVEPIRDISQVIAIADYLKEKCVRDYVMWMCGIYTGLRISDILRLRVGDVRGKSHINMREMKTGKEKKFYISDELKKVFKDYLPGKEDREYLFVSRQQTSRTHKDKIKKPPTRQRADQIIKEAAAQFGIEYVGTHTMRKTFGYHWYMKHKSVAMLMVLFNHSSEAITLSYIGVNQDIMDKSLKNFKYG